MHPNLKRLATTVTALLALGSVACAQDLSTSLPVTSVGDRLMWTVGDQVLTLNVPRAGRVRLDLYSPRVDPADYRSDTYYGDETYDARSVETTFTLRGADGTAVLSRTFAPGAAAWETLLDRDLPAGTYRVEAVTRGNGKNTFAVRLSGVSAVVSADRLLVNVHASEWLPAVKVTGDGLPHVLRMYDGDGPAELEAQLRDEQGAVTPITVSADLAYSDIPLPARAGTYTVELRQPPTARQFSNTVGFTLTRAGASEPIVVSRVGQTGQLRVTAQLVLPTGAQPTAADVTVGDATVRVDGTLDRTVEPGEYAVVPVPVPGADVRVDTSRVTVPTGGRAEAHVQVRPQVNVSVTADRPEVCVGDVVTVTARADTAYAGSLPVTLSVDAPGVEFGAPATTTGTLSAGQPRELRVTGTARVAGPLAITARAAPWDVARTVQVQVRPDTTTVQLTRDPLRDAAPGDEVTVTLRVRNVGARPAAYDVTDTADAGLTPLDAPHFTGTLAPGESRALSYRARVAGSAPAALRARLRAEGCAAEQTAAATVNVRVPGSAPEVRRVSRVLLPYDAPAQATQLVVAHRVPDGAAYVPGSSRAGDTPLPDPLRGPSGTLYWVLPGPGTAGGAVRGAVSYGVSHTAALGTLDRPSLLARYGSERSEVLEGTVSLADVNAARPLAAATAAARPVGRIESPLDGSAVRVRDRISITVRSAAGQGGTVLVNGQPVPDALIGEVRTEADGSRRVTYVGVLLRPGPNTVSIGDERVTVQLVGATARTEVTPVALVADGSTPLRVRIRTFDAFGNLTDQPTVTVGPSLEPRTPDAAPGESGYQVRLDGGEGELVLQPQATPTTLKLAVAQGSDVAQYTFEVTPDRQRVGVGTVSATLGLDGSLDVTQDLRVQARASYEGPLGRGKIYAVADTDGLPTDRDPLQRYAAYGDSSVESVPLQGIDPVAVAYDHPSFRAAYRRSAVPVDVLTVGEEITALTASTKGSVRVSGFAALVPEDRVQDQRLTPDGTRLLRLGQENVAPGSDTLHVVTLERASGKELRRVTLVRNVDYLLDTKTGIVTLARALDPVDADLNDVVVLADYRVADPMSRRQAAYGAQVKYAGARGSAGVAAVSVDDTVTFGARATYDDGRVRADGLLAYSGGLQASVDAAATLGSGSALAARLRYQDAAYGGLNPIAPGLRAGVEGTTRVGANVTASAQAEYHDAPAAGTRAQGATAQVRADYQLAPFSVGAGVRAGVGDTAGFGVVVGAGYHRAPVDVDVTHVQPLGSAGGTLHPTTTVTARYALSPTLTATVRDEIDWVSGQRATVTLDNRVGNTTYQAAYDLPTSGGQGNRARFGVTTAVSVSDRVNVGLRASAVYDVAAARTDVSAGTDVTYKTERVTATAGTDVTSRAEGFGVVLRAGVSGQLSDRLSVTADGLTEFGAGKGGVRAAVGYAYRDRTVVSLGTARYVSGTLAGSAPEFSSAVSAEYRQPAWAVRGGVDTRTLLSDPGSFTAQLGLGGTYYVGERFGVGAWGRVITQPGSGTTQYGYGVEASVRVLPGTWLTAGYNPAGFDGLGTTYTKQGAYLRLDLTVDETLGEGK